MKKKPQKNRKAAPSFGAILPNAVKIGLKEADRFLNDGDFDEAIDRLVVLDTDYPGHRPVLEKLIELGVELDAPEAVIVGGEGLARLDPENPISLVALTPAYYEAGYIFLSIDSGRRLSKTLADGDGLEELAGQLAEIESDLSGLLEAVGLGGEEGFEIAVLLDRARLRLKQERFPDTRTTCAEILAARPDFIPAMNMTAQASFAEGDLVSAIESTENALASAPDDIDSLANAVRYYVIAGKTELAQAAGVKLKATGPSEEILTLPVLAGLSYLGDDEGVLEVFFAQYTDDAAVSPNAPDIDGPLSGPIILADEIDGHLPNDDDDDEFEDEFEDEMDTVSATARHYAAVALARLGRVDEAVVQWNMALNLDPDLESASDNLEEFDLPYDQANGPWAFPLQDWIPGAVVNEIVEVLEPDTPRRHGGPSEKALINDILRRYLFLETAAAPILDRGDRMGRSLVMALSEASDSAVIHAAVRDFALGQSGPDVLRKIATVDAANHGLMPAGPVRLWLDGEWQEVTLPFV